MERYLTDQVRADLRRKMVFVGGPRQVGKTTLAWQVLGKTRRGYLNWDIPAHRERILNRKVPNTGLVVFDELHKYRFWRNYLKGLYDEQFGVRRRQILVTGSARLDFYRYGGDSLQGRYHYLRLHPLSVAELKITRAKDFAQLLTLGGFPEPFLGGALAEAQRWSREYRARLIREEITTLENVHDLGNLELLMLRLPALVGAPLSINALREDLQLSHKTVRRWIEILERLYAIFRIPPFGAPRIRAVRKEQKHYHLDWSIVPAPAQRFENLVAVHLLKWVHFHQDTEGLDWELRYFRDVDLREVDFVITDRETPLLFVECKLGDAPLSPGLRYLKARFPAAEAWQIHANGKEDYLTPNGLRVARAVELLNRFV